MTFLGISKVAPSRPNRPLRSSRGARELTRPRRPLGLLIFGAFDFCRPAGFQVASVIDITDCGTKGIHRNAVSQLTRAAAPQIT
jgi:hypothetical protein